MLLMTAYIALSISLLSLVLSGWVAYTAHLGSPEPGFAIGDKLIFYPVPRVTADSLTWGGVGFYLPITFHNRGPRGCSIREVRMIIQPKDNPTRCFDLSWREFSGVDTNEETFRRMWQTESLAQPISLEGHSSVSKTILFVWNPRTEEEMELDSGHYKLTLLGWTDETSEPDIREEISFRIKSSDKEEFERYLSEELPLTIDVPLGESRRENNVVTKEEAKQLYG